MASRSVFLNAARSSYQDRSGLRVSGDGETEAELLQSRDASVDEPRERRDHDDRRRGDDSPCALEPVGPAWMLSSPRGRRLAFGLRCEQTLLFDDASRDIGESQVALARCQLEPAEGILLGEVERLHQ